MKLAHLLLAHVSSSLAHLSLKSVKPLDPEDTMNTGCKFSGMDLIYQCTPELSDADDIHTPPVLSFCVDCRGAGGNFQNLTLYDPRHICGRLSYRKYGNSSGIVSLTTRWLPLIFDYIVTMEKEDILDIQCVPYHLRFIETISRLEESAGHTRKDSWMLPFTLLIDGREDNHKANFQPIGIDLMVYPNSDAESCTKTLGGAYDWKMNLTKSINFSHWVSYSSPVLAPLPEIFPKVDLGQQRGEIFNLDKDVLHLTVREATLYSSRHGPKSSKTWLVKVDPNFYGSTLGLNSFAVDFKLEVNSEGFPRDADEVRVELGLKLDRNGFERRFRKTAPPLLFNLTLPGNTAGMQDDSKFRSYLMITLIVVLILISLVATLGYIYWKQRRLMLQSVQPPSIGLNHPAISIEMQADCAS